MPRETSRNREILRGIQLRIADPIYCHGRKLTVTILTFKDLTKEVKSPKNPARDRETQIQQ